MTRAVAPAHARSRVQLEPGALFARDFRVVEPLSQGGMGAVYVAEQLSTGSRRALKLMHLSLASGATAKQRFEQEAKIAAKIPSEHVVQVVAAGVDETTRVPWLAMELLAGKDLERRVREDGPLSAPELLEVYGQLCHALGAAHRERIVHRDLKPENVFLANAQRADTRFTVKVLDFGIAKIVADATVVTQVVGTPLYMAPEQLDGKNISPRTDVWALGLMAFFLLTGRSYWKTAADASLPVTHLVREIVHEPLEPASARARSFGQSLPLAFDIWFAGAVQRDPNQRYADATIAHAALLHHLGMPAAAFAATEPFDMRSTAPAAPTAIRAQSAPPPPTPPAITAWIPPARSAPPPAEGGARKPLVSRRTGIVVVLVAGALLFVTIGAVAFGTRHARRPRLPATSVATAELETLVPAPAKAGGASKQGLSSEQLRTVIVKERTGVKSKCWTEARGLGVEPQTIRVTVRIDPSGRVTSARAGRRTDLADCVVRLVREWTFPAAAAETTVTFSVRFDTQ